MPQKEFPKLWLALNRMQLQVSDKSASEWKPLGLSRSPPSPAPFCSWLVTFFCHTQPHKLFPGMNSTFPVKEQPCKCFLAAYAYITNGYC